MRMRLVARPIIEIQVYSSWYGGEDRVAEKLPHEATDPGPLLI